MLTAEEELKLCKQRPTPRSSMFLVPPRMRPSFYSWYLRIAFLSEPVWWVT